HADGRLRLPLAVPSPHELRPPPEHGRVRKRRPLCIGQDGHALHERSDGVLFLRRQVPTEKLEHHALATIRAELRRSRSLFRARDSSTLTLPRARPRESALCCGAWCSTC